MLQTAWRSPHAANRHAFGLWVSPGGSNEDTIGPWLGPQAPKDPSPIKGPITRGMLRRIQMGLPQEDQIHQGPYMLFHGLKKTLKYDSTHDWSIRIAFIFGPHVRPCSRIKILKYFVFNFKIGLMQAQLNAFGREVVGEKGLVCLWLLGVMELGGDMKLQLQRK